MMRCPVCKTEIIIPLDLTQYHIVGDKIIHTCCTDVLPAIHRIMVSAGQSTFENMPLSQGLKAKKYCKKRAIVKFKNTVEASDMAKLKDMAVARGKDEMFFDPDMILEKPGFNKREMESTETQAHIRRMADCIKANGTDGFPPITIFQEDGKVYVSAGHCRRRAHSLAKAEGAPIKGICARADTLSPEDRVLDQINGNTALGLKPLETCEAVKELASFGWTVAEVARRTAQSSTTVENQLLLANAPTEIKLMVKSGEVSARMATDVLRSDGAKAAEVLKRAIQTAQEKGKAKATPKHIEKKPGIKWGTWGPKLQTVLDELFTTKEGSSERDDTLNKLEAMLAKIKEGTEQAKPC